jgi:tetratricopeptide (TPR) repeat protein
MKRNHSLWLGLPAAAGLMAFALSTALAQTAAPMGKIHGHVTNPSGASQTGGTVTLVGVDRAASGPGLAAMTSEKGTFPVDANGDYSGQVPPGIYQAVYRSPGMSAEKQADHADNVKIVAGQDTLQDIDMSRKEYIEALPEDQKKQLEELRKHNSEAMKANEIIKGLNADLRIVGQDFKDADGAHLAAVQALGATAAKSDIEAKEAEIKTAKYTEVETLMTKDTGAKADASILWAYLGQAQVGLKKYDEAEATYKKVLDIESTSKKPNPQVQGLAQSGLGEVYARTGKVPEANAAYDAAAKANPVQAGIYLKNEAVIYSQMGNADAQAAAADEAIKADPTQPLPYYLKGQGLIAKATVDASGKYVLPPGCAESYQKYLELAPTGPYAAEVKAILDQSTQTVNTTYKADKPKKK